MIRRENEGGDGGRGRNKEGRARGGRGTGEVAGVGGRCKGRRRAKGRRTTADLVARRGGADSKREPGVAEREDEATEAHFRQRRRLPAVPCLQNRTVEDGKFSQTRQGDYLAR